MISKSVKKLVNYGLATELISKADEIYARNRILEILGIDEYKECDDNCEGADLEEILSELLGYAVEKGLIDDNITDRDLFDTKRILSSRAVN